MEFSGEKQNKISQFKSKENAALECTSLESVILATEPG